MSDKSMSMLFTFKEHCLAFFVLFTRCMFLKSVHHPTYTLCVRVHMFNGILSYIVWVWQWWGCSIEWTVAWFLSHTNKSISHHLWRCSKELWVSLVPFLKVLPGMCKHHSPSATHWAVGLNLVAIQQMFRL